MVLTADKKEIIDKVVDRFNESKAGAIVIKTKDGCRIDIDKHRINVNASYFSSTTWTYSHWKVFLIKPRYGELNILQRNMEDWSESMCFMSISAESIVHMEYV